MQLTTGQVETIYKKTRGYSKETKLDLRTVSAVTYNDNGGYNPNTRSVFLHVFLVEYEIFENGTHIARNTKTGATII